MHILVHILDGVGIVALSIATTFLAPKPTHKK